MLGWGPGPGAQGPGSRARAGAPGPGAWAWGRDGGRGVVMYLLQGMVSNNHKMYSVHYLRGGMVSPPFVGGIGLAWPDTNTSQELEAADCGNQGYMCDKAFVARLF